MARAFGKKGLTLCRELGDKKATEMLLFNLGVLAMRQADYERARALFEECLNLGHELAEEWRYGRTLVQLGILARFQGDDERATTVHTQGLAVLKDAGDKWHIAYALHRSARDVLLRQGHYDQAAASFAESLILCGEVGNRWISEECLEGWRESRR